MTYRKKLIEVALPLEAINIASAREKSIRHGHPSTLHLWWARRPLATCRAVLFASLVDDPSEHPEKFPTEQDQERERERLFRLIEQMVQWENSNKEDVLQKAREEILKSTDGNPMPSRILWNDVYREGALLSPDLASGICCDVAFHHIWDGISFRRGSCDKAEMKLRKRGGSVLTEPVKRLGADFWPWALC
jgi:hypothetical protein